MSDNKGVKHDQGKIRVDLVPFDAVMEIAKVLTFGSIKYAARNWERGMAWSRAYGALMRHMWLWFHGQDKDHETRLSHLANAGCCLFFLISWELRGVGDDDRPKLDPKVLEGMSDTSIIESAMAVIAEAQRQKEEAERAKAAKNGSEESVELRA